MNILHATSGRIYNISGQFDQQVVWKLNIGGGHTHAKLIYFIKYSFILTRKAEYNVTSKSWFKMKKLSTCKVPILQSGCKLLKHEKREPLYLFGGRFVAATWAQFPGNKYLNTKRRRQLKNNKFCTMLVLAKIYWQQAWAAPNPWDSIFKLIIMNESDPAKSYFTWWSPAPAALF